MSLDYYLYCRKEYDDIINYLHEIISKYELISDITTSENDLEDTYYELFKPEHNKIFFIDRLRHIKHLKKLCDWKIEELCRHEFVEDLIDITPDESKHITYCKICEYTKDI
jgi:hypothetical protein